VAAKRVAQRSVDEVEYSQGSVPIVLNPMSKIRPELGMEDGLAFKCP
jgi:hypothetical protein